MKAFHVCVAGGVAAAVAAAASGALTISDGYTKLGSSYEAGFGTQTGSYGTVTSSADLLSLDLVVSDYLSTAAWRLSWDSAADLSDIVIDLEYVDASYMTFGSFVSDDGVSGMPSTYYTAMGSGTHTLNLDLSEWSGVNYLWLTVGCGAGWDLGIGSLSATVGGAVPAPGALALLGMAGLAGRRRRR